MERMIPVVSGGRFAPLPWRTDTLLYVLCLSIRALTGDAGSMLSNQACHRRTDATGLHVGDASLRSREWEWWGLGPEGRFPFLQRERVQGISCSTEPTRPSTVVWCRLRTCLKGRGFQDRSREQGGRVLSAGCGCVRQATLVMGHTACSYHTQSSCFPTADHTSTQGGRQKMTLTGGAAF